MQQRKGVQYILLAEDDEEDAAFFSSALQEVAPDAALAIAHNEETVFEKLQTKIPDLLFLDSILIHVKGTECLAKIRRQEAYRNIPVIIYSGDMNKAKITEAFAAGANLYAVKPSTMKSIQDFLKHVLAMDWSDLSKIQQQYYYNNKTVLIS